MKKLKLIRNFLTLFAVLATVVFISCGALFGNGQNGNITINLPPISSQARAISSDKISDLKNVTTSYRVTANGMTREGTGGTYTFMLPVGVTAEVTVECLNSSGNVIVRAKKTHTVTAGTNSVSINLSRDGDVVASPNAELKSTPSVGSIIMKDGTLCDITSVVGREADAIAVVYKVAGGKAWAVGKTHEKNGLEWCLQNATGYNTNFTSLQGEPDFGGTAGSYTWSQGQNTDGSSNWQKLKTALGSNDDTSIVGNYPAWEWVNAYGMTNCSGTIFTSGWYFPTLAELFDIWKEKTNADASLTAISASTFGSDYYWSSSQSDPNGKYALRLKFEADWSNPSRDDSNSVCAVRQFTY